ncbi:MAG TPA: hypothetical protein VMV70_08135 [Gallionella sp.]|nr:hypothetical protein [Gallionella sp.]
MMENRYKIQGKRFKVQDLGGFSCTLPLASASVQRGFSLISAIFLLVVIAALGTFAVTISTSQQQSAVLDLRGASAYQAARAGIEWAAYGVSQTASGVKWTGCVPTTTLNGLGGTLAPFTVTVTCATPTSYVEGSNKIWIYNVTSKANTSAAVGTLGYVERDITVKLGR